MKFAIGSTSAIKIDAARKALSSLLHGKKIEILTYKSKSRVPETPIGKHTINGARNRAIDAKNNVAGADYYIGVESGLVNRYGSVYEEAWCCMIDKKGREYYAYSSGLKVPDPIVEAMRRYKTTHNRIMISLQERYGFIVGDTWGNYTGSVLSRKASVEEAVRNALVQIFPGRKGIYKGHYHI